MSEESVSSEGSVEQSLELRVNNALVSLSSEDGFTPENLLEYQDARMELFDIVRDGLGSLGSKFEQTLSGRRDAARGLLDLGQKGEEYYGRVDFNRLLDRIREMVDEAKEDVGRAIDYGRIPMPSHYSHEDLGGIGNQMTIRRERIDEVTGYNSLIEGLPDKK
jgi:hypothetical protein